MKFAVVYSSITGNTALLANQIKEVLKTHECVYFGKPNEKAFEADFIFVGFWTDKGSCHDEIEAFLKKLHMKHIFLFGTAGFGGDQSYFDRIIENVHKFLSNDNILTTTFMCQGKMPITVRQRYEQILPHNDGMKAQIKNFDNALTHPNNKDLQALKEMVENVVN